MPVTTTTTARVYSNFSANLICKTVADTLNAAGFKAHNHYGITPKEFDQILQQQGHVYVFFEGFDNTILTGSSTDTRIWLQMLVVDQNFGAADASTAYVIDHLYQYFTQEQWRHLGLQALYTTYNFEYFFVESVRNYIPIDMPGRMVSILRGYIDCNFTGMNS